jgi:uncharacterized LabA/DUF88 family protein
MRKKQNNYAFIDAQNVHLGVKRMGWLLDWKRFRTYLSEKHGITQAFIFIGFVAEGVSRYTKLQEAGYIVVFKPTLEDKEGKIKGNCDADMVLHAMIEYANYDKVLLVSSDGDFYSLAEYLKKQEKLLYVLSPEKRYCSSLLRRAAQELMLYMDSLQAKIGKRLG